MKKNYKILGIIIVLLFLLSISFIFLYLILKQEVKDSEKPSIEMEVTEDLENIESVIEKHDSIYISTDNRKIYVNFKVDLFEENGKSNQEYFEKLINDLINLKQLKNNSFNIYDEEKKIIIIVKYNQEEKSHTIRYNYQEDFYNEVDGKSYMTVGKTQIIKKENIIPIAKELKYLIGSGMYFKSIKDGVGEGTDLGNGYSSYMDGKILLKIADYKVKSIIFTPKYEDSVFSQIKVGMPLEEIVKIYDNSYKGSPEEGYLMYRTKDVYTFIYEDEIIVYGYNYSENEKFEKWLEEYIDEKNFEMFISRVTSYWTNYDICTYDLDTQNAYITYPSRGIEIKITENDFSKSTFYNNYFFDNYSKKLVQEGKAKLNYSDDYLEIAEKQRRDNVVR